MSNSSGFSVKLEKLFWAFLLVNPFLDIINGLFINLVLGVDVLDVKFATTLGVTPSLVVRMAMLLVFALYILTIRDRKSILAAVPIGVCWVLSVISEYRLLGSAALFVDIQYAARFCYNIALLMVYTRVFAARWDGDGGALLRRLNDIAALTLLILSFSILLSAVIGVGYSTYADRLGYRGNRGFFYAGNDISAVLFLLMPVIAAALMSMERKHPGRTALYALAVGCGANALFIIGSKTAFLAVALTFLVLLICAVRSVVRLGFSQSEAGGYLMCVGAAAAVFFALMLLSDFALWDSIVSSFSATGEVAKQEGTRAALMSGRQFKLADHFTMFKNGGISVWLFGMGRGSQSEILEMDVLEVLFYYGICGVAAFLFLYAKVAIEFFARFLRRRGTMCTALVLSLAVCSGYLIVAGHVLFSVTSGFYFVFVIVYSRICFADRAEDILLWRQKAAAEQ